MSTGQCESSFPLESNIPGFQAFGTEYFVFSDSLSGEMFTYLI